MLNVVMGGSGWGLLFVRRMFRQRRRTKTQRLAGFIRHAVLIRDAAAVQCVQEMMRSASALEETWKLQPWVKKFADRVHMSAACPRNEKDAATAPAASETRFKSMRYHCDTGLI